MDKQDLAAKADRIRGIVARIDADEHLGEKQMRYAIRSVEDIAQALLKLGAADPDLKAEIIGWVVRFRAKKEMLPGPTARKAKQVEPARKPEAAETPVARRLPPRAMQSKTRAPHTKPGRKEPVTQVFTYDTTAPRTADPGFVKKARAIPAAVGRQLRPAAPPAPLGSTRSALLFAKKFERLREDVRRASRRPHGSADSVLKARISELYQARTTSLDTKHHHNVAKELNSFAQALGTTISSFRAGPGSFGYTPVP